jgi:hypothetical protein
MGGRYGGLTQENKTKKNKSVRFAGEPQIIEVESYKKYNRDVSNNASFCQSCSLI